LYAGIPVTAQNPGRETVYQCLEDHTIFDSREDPRDSIGTVQAGAYVIVIDGGKAALWSVEVNGETGYIMKTGLKRVKGISPEDLRGWETSEKSTGDEPDCLNYTPRYNRDLENYLKIRVGDADVAVKLMDNADHMCVRYVYIRGGETLSLENIPEGVYYLKIAIGRDWRQKIVNNRCIGKFMRDAEYNRSQQPLDYRREELPDGYSLPSYEVVLMPVTRDPRERFKTRDISEEEFNR
jgi:hypothetical protein